MKLGLKQKAFIYTLALFVGTFVGAYAMAHIVDLLDRETIQTILAFGMLGGFFYLTYQLMISRLEYKQSLTTLNDSFKK